MFNNVSGKGFSDASKEVTKMIKELKPLLWVVSIAFAVAMIIHAIADLIAVF